MSYSRFLKFTTREQIGSSSASKKKGEEVIKKVLVRTKARKQGKLSNQGAASKKARKQVGSQKRTFSSGRLYPLTTNLVDVL